MMEQQDYRLEFDADFEGGSIDRVLRLGVDWYHFSLRPDATSYFYFRIQGCRGREIIFEWRHAIGYGRAKCPMENQDLWPPDQPPYQGAFPLVSYDQKTWNKVDHCEINWQFPNSYFAFFFFRFPVRFPFGCAFSFASCS